MMEPAYQRCDKAARGLIAPGRFAPMTSASRLMGAVLVIACTTGVAACGSGDSAQNAAAAAAVSQTFLNLGTSDEKPTTSQAACFGTGIISAFGVSQAIKDGFITQDHKPVTSLTLMLTTKDAATYADLYLKCADPAPAIKSALIARIGPKTATAQQQLKTCLDKTLTSALMRKALIAAASGDAANATLAPVFNACGRLG